MWEPETARLLHRIGLGSGAHCLDVGCGPGESMRLMAERVGPAGRVRGVDADAVLGAQAVSALHAAGHRQCSFEAANIEAGPVAEAPFDLVFARLLLLHVDDAVDVLERLGALVAPGGHLVIQDYDLLTGEVVPRLDAIDEFKQIALGTFANAGRDLRLGLRLPDLHVEAGIGVPDGTDVGVHLAPLAEVAPLYEAVYRSVLPTAVSFGLTTQPEGERWLAEFPSVAAGAARHAALWPLLIGAFTRKPGGDDR